MDNGAAGNPHNAHILGKTKLSLVKYNGKWRISKITRNIEKYVNCNFIAGLNDINRIYDF